MKTQAKEEFDAFWEGQNGVRALFLMDDVIQVDAAPEFRLYGRALEWGYPRGVGYRYLTVCQGLLLLRITSLPETAFEGYTTTMLADTRGPS